MLPSATGRHSVSIVEQISATEYFEAICLRDAP